MAQDSNGIIKSIVELKRENEELENLINFYKMENFDYALKCNHMENVLTNIDSVIRTYPPKLLDSLNDMCNILQICGFDKGKSVLVPEDKTVSKPLLQQSIGKSTPPNKAHVVKPHMVNGHILYVPTINLTRVSNLNTQNNNSNENESMVRMSNSENDDETQLPINRSVSRENDVEMREESESQEEFHSENPLSAIEELPEPSTSSASKSPSHSTVLSGTFQEVKIYLNQVRPESLQEEPNTSKRRTKSRCRKSSSRRSTVSFDHITMRKKS